MNLRKIEIQNFRGITNLELNIGDTTVLIGENNTGKTAVLDALRFALREVRSRRGCSFNAYDFHLPNSTAEPADSNAISIRLTFAEKVPGEWNDDQVGRLNRAKIAQSNAAGCTVVILKVGARFDAASQDFIQDWEFQNLDGIALSNVPDTAIMTLQNEVSYYYLAALREAARHFDAKGAFWRPFLKESQLSPEKRKEIEDKLAAVNQLIISSHGSFTQVMDKLKDVQRVIPIYNTGASEVVAVDAVPGRLFDMLAKAQVSLNTETGAKVPVDHHGEGTQSLVVLMLFNAFLQAWNKGTPIVALEEPEAHLHPSAIRALWQLIDQIPGQKIISTHSGDLLSEVPPEVVTRLYRRDGSICASYLRNAGLDPDEQRKFNFNIRHARGELLFARCWILGEGETEATLLPAVARYLGINLERAGVRCVAYQTGISIETGLKAANCMGISWVVLADNDVQGADDIKKVRDNLNARNESEILFIIPQANIEEYLCACGFGSVYESFLTEETRKRVIVDTSDPSYWPQVLKAIKNLRKFSKPAAIQLVMRLISSGKQKVPDLLVQTIKAAVKLAEAS